jgi:transposase
VHNIKSQETPPSILIPSHCELILPFDHRRIKLPSNEAGSIGTQIGEVLGKLDQIDQSGSQQFMQRHRPEIGYSPSASVPAFNEKARPLKRCCVDKKWAIIAEIQSLLGSNNGPNLNCDKHYLENAVFKKVAVLFGLAAITIKRYWIDYSNQLLDGKLVPNLEPKQHSGRPTELDTEKCQAIKLSSQKRKYHTTARNISRDAEVDSHVIIPPTSAWRYRQIMGYTKRNEYAKTGISLSHRIQRLEWALDEVEVVNDAVGTVIYRFKDLRKRAFFDEKWFDLKTKGKIYRYY